MALNQNPRFPYLQQMDIILKIEASLAGKENSLALCFKQSIKDEPAKQTIAMVKDMAGDNFNMVADILGIKLTETIKNFEV